MRGDLPSGTVTFLFTDVEGSTRLLHELGQEGYAEALARHRRVLREAFRSRGGVEVDTQGDAFLYAFTDARDALVAAAAGTERLAAGRIRVRIGVHTGTPLLTDEGYVGEDVHLGARIAAAGHGGQVLLSAATRSAAGGDVSDLGEHRLKDFPGPVAIFQLGSTRFPPLKTISNTNLPRPASSFVGREREVAEVVALLSGHRLVTLSGPGGSGKTRLALEAAAEMVGEFRAGVFWIGLATLRDPSLVADTIAEALGAKDGLSQWIGERELLLLLDNLEQVIDVAPELAELLEACANLRLLVTSRELLRVRGEVDYPVLPLADPDAVELFTARAGVEGDEVVAQLCRRLDNLPLALELAAARTRVLAPAQILERLSQRLDLLKGGRDADPRQQTLRATIEWSYDLLDDEERRCFARLAVFGGGCTLDAAEEIAGADLDVLQSLVDKSLLRHTGDRFWMLETIREYALGRLEQCGEAEELRRRLADHFLALAEKAELELPGPTAVRWLDRLGVEHENLRAALDIFERSERQDALRLASALRVFWLRRGHLREGRERVERLLAAAPEPTPARAGALIAASGLAANTGDDEAARLRAEEALELYERRGDERGLAFATFALGYSAGDDEDDLEPAVRLMEEARERFRRLGDDDLARQATLNVGYYHQARGDYEQGCVLLEEALADARRAGHAAHEASALGQLAVGDRDRGRHAAALTALARSLTIWARLDDPAMQARDLRRIAYSLAKLGRADAAARVLAASEALRDEIGHDEGWIAAITAEILAEIRQGLDERAFERAWTEGRRLSSEEAAALALRHGEEVEVVEGGAEEVVP